MAYCTIPQSHSARLEQADNLVTLSGYVFFSVLPPCTLSLWLSWAAFFTTEAQRTQRTHREFSSAQPRNIG